MKKQAENNEDAEQSGELTVERLLAEAKRGRSKFDEFASDIEQLRAGGVTLRSTVTYLVSKGIKAEVGELGQWLKRRRNRHIKLAAEAAQRPARTQPKASATVTKSATTLPLVTSPSETASQPSVAGRPAWVPSSRDVDADFLAKMERQAAKRITDIARRSRGQQKV